MRTRSIAVSFSLFNILILVSRTSNSFQGPFLAKRIESNIAGGVSHGLLADFRWMLWSATLAGWLRIRIAGPNGEARLCALYTPRDTFSELVHAVGTLYRYGDDQTVLVNEEPEQVELELLKRGDKLVIEVVRRRATTMRNECGFNSGCRQFALRLKRTLEETSYETFADHWRHRPPRHDVRQLWSYFSAQSRSPQSR